MTINGVLELKAVLVACEDGRYKPDEIRGGMRGLFLRPDDEAAG